MQNTDRWHSDQFQPTHIWNPWSNKTDANLEDSACTVRVLLFFPIINIGLSLDKIEHFYKVTIFLPQNDAEEKSCHFVKGLNFA